ncbi:cobalt ECF transporter T component CbiQ [Geomobilimonas luticola]|uniref:Cobalt ECF transporter T component CbiQ n=1 Tax=Geomobilimonas luticola TaxID=1114878 RepID=A0ABS5SAL0_9BACT|nr:cobalt ECF transporter T component CbiQ [Geomobilimonas luticola]MBT0652205.1 cobalt ECF transporter T component CbiQ [Geomobilimonas luticola]
MHHFVRQPALDDHPLTRLDARVKLLSALALLLMVISCRGIVFPLLVAGICGGICLSLGVRPRVLALRFAEPLFIAGMVLVLKLFFTGTEPLFSFSLAGWEVVGHRDGLMEGVRIASRIAGAVTVVAAIGFATPFTDLMAALAWLRVPKGFIEVALFAWRYLFLLLDDAQVVYAAQKNRLGYACYRRGLRSFGTLAGALVIKAFDNSQNITTAMVQRGYDGTMPLMKHRPFHVGEVAVALLVVVGMGFVWSL